MIGLGPSLERTGYQIKNQREGDDHAHDRLLVLGIRARREAGPH